MNFHGKLAVLFGKLVPIILLVQLCGFPLGDVRPAAAQNRTAAHPLAKSTKVKLGNKRSFKKTVWSGKSVPTRKKAKKSDWGVPFQYCLLEYGLYPRSGVIHLYPYYGPVGNTANQSGLRWYAAASVSPICAANVSLAGGTGEGWADTNMFGSFPTDPYAVALLRFSSNNFKNYLCGGGSETVSGMLYLYLRAPRYQSINSYGQILLGDLRYEAYVQGVYSQNWYYVMTC